MNTQQPFGRWIRVEPDSYVKTKGAEVGVFISPYDIPAGVRGRYDEEIGRFVVEFRYMVNEKYRRLDRGNGVCLRLGEHSSRIVGVEVDVDVSRSRASQVPISVGTDTAASAAIGQAIQNVSNAKSAQARRWENYVVAQRVIEDKHDDIFGCVHHAPAD